MGLKVLSFLSKSLEVLGTNGSNKKSLSFQSDLLKSNIEISFDIM